MDSNLMSLLGCFSAYIKIAVDFGAPWPSGYGPDKKRCDDTCQLCLPPRSVAASWCPLGTRLAFEVKSAWAPNVWHPVHAPTLRSNARAAVCNLIQVKIDARPVTFSAIDQLEEVKRAVMEDALVALQRIACACDR